MIITLGEAPGKQYDDSEKGMSGLEWTLREYLKDEPHLPPFKREWGGWGGKNAETGRKRTWAFDFANLEYWIALEVEGGEFASRYGGKSRHTTGTGYTNDTVKYNVAQAQGWCVLRFPGAVVNTQFDTLILPVIEQALTTRGWKDPRK